MAQKILKNASLVDLAVFVKCTYAIAYSVPAYNKLNRVRTYNKNQLNLVFQADGQKGYVFQKRYYDLNYLDSKGFQYGISKGQCGVLTGEYLIDNRRPQIWLRARLLYSDRLEYGWFRSIDVLPDVTNDLLPKNGNTNTTNSSSKSNWFWWIAAGLSLLAK